MPHKLITAFAIGTLVSLPLQAQQIGPMDPTSLDARATVGVTIPLGGRRGDVANRPRAELRLGQGPTAGTYRSDRSSLRAIGLRGTDSIEPAPGTLAVTLGSDPRWSVAGRVLNADEDETPEDDDGIDTFEGIGIGVGAILVAAGVAFAVLILPALDCDADEEC